MGEPWQGEGPGQRWNRDGTVSEGPESTAEPAGPAPQDPELTGHREQTVADIRDYLSGTTPEEAAVDKFPTERFREAGATDAEITQLEGEYDRSDAAVQSGTHDLLASMSTQGLSDYLGRLREADYFSIEAAESPDAEATEDAGGDQASEAAATAAAGDTPAKAAAPEPAPQDPASPGDPVAEAEAAIAKDEEQMAADTQALASAEAAAEEHAGHDAG